MQYVWKTFWNCEQFEQAHQTRAWFPMIVCKTNTKYWKYKWFLKDTTFFIIYTIFLCLNLFQGNITGFLLSQKKHIFAHSVQTDTAAKLLWRIMSKVMRAKQAVHFVEDHFLVYHCILPDALYGRWNSLLVHKFPHIRVHISTHICRRGCHVAFRCDTPSGVLI